MNKKRAKTKEIGDESPDSGVVSATDMTGLIPSMPETDEEKENYAQIVRYRKKR